MTNGRCGSIAGLQNSDSEENGTGREYRELDGLGQRFNLEMVRPLEPSTVSALFALKQAMHEGMGQVVGQMFSLNLQFRETFYLCRNQRRFCPTIPERCGHGKGVREVGSAAETRGTGGRMRATTGT
jgi:hypothetical protein